MQKPTPEEFRASQREIWAAAAAGWRKWWRVFETCARPLSERMVELAGIGPGSRVLDVATGNGEPALTAARRAGPSGRVLGTDLASEMLDFARERERAARADCPALAPVEFEERDAERLELPEAGFDAVLSRWGLMLFGDPPAALAGMRRALVPRGRLVAAVWGTKEVVPFMRLCDVLAERELGIPPAPPDVPGPLRFGRPGQVSELLCAAGFADVTEERFEVVLEFATPGEYADFRRDLSVTLGRLLAERTEAERERFWRRLTEEAQAFRTSSGSIRFVNEVRIARGLRP